MPENYDALLVVSFGGPEGRADVLPFLENVLRGKPVPRERMLEVAEHYYHFDGRSPLNTQNRELIAALRTELLARGQNLPVFWGNRNWHPLLPDALWQMRDAGVRRALAFVTSAFSSYSGCRQYREDIDRARQEIGAGAASVDKLRVFFNHPGFVGTVVERIKAEVARIPAERRAATPLIFTAHSIPESMAEGCRYAAQLQEASALVAGHFPEMPWQLAYQSRSGSPTQAWLEPDIKDALRQLIAAGHHREVVVSPLGFLSDHMEVLFDLDTEARELCAAHGLTMLRAATPGTHPLFVAMIADLIAERQTGGPRLALGDGGPSHDVCPADCCPLRR